MATTNNMMGSILAAKQKTEDWIAKQKEAPVEVPSAPAGAADVVADLQQRNNIDVQPTEQTTVTPGVIDLRTGQYIYSDSPMYDKYRRANDAVNRLGEYFDHDGLDYNIKDFREQAGADYSALNEVYGNMSGLKRGLDNPELPGITSDIYKKSKDIKSAAALARAQEEADRDVTVTGINKDYTVSRQNADEIKELISMYGSTNNADVQKQVITSLVDKLNAAGFEIAIDPANPPKNYDELESLILNGENGLDRYRDLNAILQEASRDRMPKEQEHKTVEELARERMERQYAIDRDREARRLKAERLGHGIADLSATIGDMIRAHEGAPVNPRDWHRIYDELTAQERANINNYQMRMAKLNEDRRRERMAAAKAAAKADEVEQKHQNAMEKQQANNEFKAGENEKNRDLRLRLAEMKNKNQYNIALIRNGGEGKGIDLVIDGNRYKFNNNADLRVFIDGLDGIIRNKDNWPQGYKVPQINIKDDWDPVRKAVEVENFVVSFFQNDFNNAPEETKQLIADYLATQTHKLYGSGSSTSGSNGGYDPDDEGNGGL